LDYFHSISTLLQKPNVICPYSFLQTELIPNEKIHPWVSHDFGEWSALGSRDMDGETREGERAGSERVIELNRLAGLPQFRRR
jgi:hypothetical protein